MRTWLSLTFALSLCVAPAVAEKKTAGDSKKFQWTVLQIGQQDYLKLSEIAQFYQLPTTFNVVDKRINLDNGRSQIEVAIDSREAFVNGVRKWFAFPVVQSGTEYFVSRIDLTKTIEPALRPHLVAGYKPFKTVIIDAGHGGEDKGAPSAWGVEKNYALDTARRLRDLLKSRGYRVVMTRDSDVFIPLEERAIMANQYKGAIFVSVHYNSTGTNPDANGVEIFCLTPRGAPSTNDDSPDARNFSPSAGHIADQVSFPLACAIQHSILGNTPQFDRGVKRARFAVLRRTVMPSVLVECGFLSNLPEARQIASPAWRQKMAVAIAEGIDNYKNLVETKKPFKLVAEYRKTLPTGVTLRDATVASSATESSSPPALQVEPASNTGVGDSNSSNQEKIQ